MLLFTHDKTRLEKFFVKTPALYAFHLGDLDDFYFDHCQWAVTHGDKVHIQEVVLVYHGLSSPSVLAYGKTELLSDLLRELIEILPRRFFCHFHEADRQIFKSRYNETDLGAHLRMELIDKSQLAKQVGSDSSVVRLDASHEPGLKALYDKAYPDTYYESQMLASGKYLGYFEQERLVAVSGVHVDSARYQISVLGNIATDPEFRGRGLATMLTASLCTELVDENKLIYLNVKADNTPAIRCYENLGFEKAYEYQEALFEQR